LSKTPSISGVKVVIIGAGSTVFTPGLIVDLVNSPYLRDATVALVDIDHRAVDVMSRLALRIARERGANLHVETATDRREALPGASFVTTTIAVGGAPAWAEDLRIPERHGVYQTVGDTVGPGGVSRALRHIPELVAIAQDIEELSPEAWLFNYTNPLSANVRAVQKATRVKSIGLCHGVLHTRRAIADELGLRASEVNAVFAGINHLSWLLDLRYQGRDLYPSFEEKMLSKLDARSEPAPSDPYGGPQKVSATLLDIYGRYPAPGDRHVAEFFPYFLRHEQDGLAYGLQSSLDLTNDLVAGKGTLWERLAAEANGLAPLDDQLFAETREGERVVNIIESILRDQWSLELAVNVRNDGLIPNLPSEAIVEVPGVVSGSGVRGIGVGPLPQAIADLLRARIDQQELTVDAALTGNRRLALQALLADPLVYDIESARGMLDEAIVAHAEHLPASLQGDGAPARSHELAARN
jgi:alpha-galactosidase/6-phospho-beta-glucosidase family protein